MLNLIAIIDKRHADIGRGASVNKAVYLIEHFGENLPRRNKKDLIEYWTAAKPVAHLCAAFVRLRRDMVIAEREEYWLFLLRDWLGPFLAYASQFEAFATNFKAHGQRRPLLERANIFTVPPGLMLPKKPIHLPRLTAEQLATLQGYRSPTPSY